MSMSKILAIQAAEAMLPDNGDGTLTAAIERCGAAFRAEMESAKKAGYKPGECVQRARLAYKVSIPPMMDRQSILLAIACITYAMHLDIFDGAEASRLLYAAQVALSVIRQAGGQK